MDYYLVKRFPHQHNIVILCAGLVTTLASLPLRLPLANESQLRKVLHGKYSVAAFVCCVHC